jgi:hypothetical protein
MYTAKLNELKAVTKVSARAGESGAVSKTSVESAAQDDDFREVKRRKRQSLIIPQRQPKSRLNQSQHQQLSPNGVLARNFFASLRTTDMHMEITEAENTQP